MTTTLNATTSNGLVVTPDNSGNIVLQYNGAAAPAFSAYNSATQSVSSTTWTKVNLDTEIFDTNNNFASSRFTPTVAGYYQINGSVWVGSGVGTLLCAIYKNGSVYVYSNRTDSSTSQNFAVNVSQVIYCNGSTDYIELYGYTSGTSLSNGSPNFTMLSGCLLRGA